MISGAQLFVAVWLGCSCVYAVPVWATLALSKARRACGAYVEFDHLIEAVERRGLLPVGALLGCLLFPLSLAYDVVMVRAKLEELETIKKNVAKLQTQIDAERVELPELEPCETCGSMVPVTPGYTPWSKKHFSVDVVDKENVK